MKKIGILTFQSTVNYGAQLQNFALQEFISKNNKNLDVCVINYDNKTVNSIERKFNLKDQKNLKDFIKYLKNGRSKKRRWLSFEKFRKEYINLTREYTERDIKRVDSKIDYYVVGSDQVWNLDITGSDYTYFLNFVKDKEKKESYAASLGKTIFTKQESAKISKFLSEFNHINVREKSAEEFLKSKKIKNVNTVMDPTFLLSKEEWERLFELKSINGKNEYILVYMIDNIKENFKKIKKFAKKNKLKVVYLTNDFFNIHKVKNIRDASPIDFLNYIYNSKYVVTGSFHAICFSIIFNKNFYYAYNQHNGRNSRLKDLLNSLNIENDNNITNISIINKCQLDYKKINGILRKQINHSKNSLNDIIKKWSD